MKILITGATGFIGQHLLEELKDDGFSITAISRKESPKFWCANKNFLIHKGDIADKNSIESAFAHVSIVVSLAAEISDPGKLVTTNINGVQNIIDLAAKNEVKKIIHLSSVGVVGMQYSRERIVVDSVFKCEPKNEYERTKLQSEILLREFGKKSKTGINILRPTNVIGDHHPRKALLLFLQRLKVHKVVPATEQTMVNYVYAKDVAHAIRFCILNNIGSKTFNVGEAQPFEDFISDASKGLNTVCKIKVIPLWFFAIGEVLNYLGLSKIKARLRAISNRVEYEDEFMKGHIHYKYGITEGLRRTIDYYTSEKLL